ENQVAPSTAATPAPYFNSGSGSCQLNSSSPLSGETTENVTGLPSESAYRFVPPSPSGPQPVKRTLIEVIATPRSVSGSAAGGAAAARGSVPADGTAAEPSPRAAEPSRPVCRSRRRDVDMGDLLVENCANSACNPLHCLSRAIRPSSHGRIGRAPRYRGPGPLTAGHSIGKE